MSTGTQGTLYVGGLVAGTLSEWRVVTSPTTGKPTLFGEGRFARYFLQGVGSMCEVSLIPAQITARIGRSRPPKMQPFRLTGRLVEITTRNITIAEGVITARG